MDLKKRLALGLWVVYNSPCCEKKMVRWYRCVLRTSRRIGDKNMNEIIKNIENAQLKAEVPQFSVGDTVRVHALIKEGNRERVQIFEGTVLKKQGGSARETFTVRKFSNGVGVEKTWPLHSPHVVKVEVIRHGKVRRAKLYYLRDRVGKAAKVKERVR
jgi:large subunit ribosomal protein L19